jgi:hypothetical protein
MYYPLLHLPSPRRVFDLTGGGRVGVRDTPKTNFGLQRKLKLLGDVNIALFILKNNSTL